MKTALALTLALTLPGVALAQTAAPAQTPAAAPQTTPPARPAPSGPTATGPAAATLPNSFDDGPARAPAPRAPAASPAAPGAALPQSDPAKVALAEGAIRKTVAAFQAGQPNYGDMTPDLAEKVRAQAASILPLFQQFGALRTVAYVGTEDDAELFSVVFANAPTQWIIALNPEGKIIAVLFRPAPAA